ncbi:MAG: endonuclease MutS2, partial [Armatimonadota bacterium]
MDEHALRVLEYNKIIDKLIEKTSTSLGMQTAKLTYPTTHLQTAINKQKETSEARDILEFVGNIPLGGISDIKPLAERGKVGSMLQPKELLTIQETLQSSERLKLFLLKLIDKYPIMAGIAKEISDFKKIVNEISYAISSNGEVMDSASIELAKVRTELRSTQHRITEKLNNYIQSSQYRIYIQEPVITVRNERYCIPVKAEYKAQISGIVHDTSSSGATLFIEPTPIVEMGNRRTQLLVKEKEEVEKILKKLSETVGEYAEEILFSMDTIGIIDCITAKAQLSISMNAVEPILNDKGKVELIAARHPLLEGDVVPIDMPLGKKFNGLLITGPNTGGKTVSLKTLGLFSLMGASGMHVPALPGTELAVFSEIFADIGDEQSIEQSLSTF